MTKATDHVEFDKRIPLGSPEEFIVLELMEVYLRHFGDNGRGPHFIAQAIKEMGGGNIPIRRLRLVLERRRLDTPTTIQ